MIVPEILLSFATGIFTGAIALTLMIWLIQDDQAFTLIHTFFVCLVYNIIVTGVVFLYSVVSTAAILAFGVYGIIIALLAALGALTFCLRLLMKWCGFSLWTSLAVTIAAIFVQWGILTVSTQIIEKLVGP